MTASKKTYRKRRITSANSIPKWIKKWFEGEINFCFHAFSYPFTAHMDEYWVAWKELHPEADITKYKRLEQLVSEAPGRRKFLEGKRNDS